MNLLSKYFSKVFNTTSTTTKEKSLEDVLQMLHMIDANDDSAGKKITELVSKNNQLKNDYSVQSTIMRIPYKSSYKPTTEEINQYRSGVEHVKMIIKLKIADLLEQNDDTQNIDLQTDLIFSEQVKNTIELISRTLDANSELAKYGVDLPTGILFWWPPGVGKTESARWISKHSNLNFVYISISDIMHGIVGSSEKAMTSVFQDARNQTLQTGKPTIIFLDEADKLLGSRKESQHSLVQHFLSLVDGFYKNKWTITILSTNEVAMLDNAVLSRMAEKLEFALPNEAHIEQILRVHILKWVTDAQMKQGFMSFFEENKAFLTATYTQLATLGTSGRDIKNIAQSAKRHFALNHLQDNTTPFTKEYLIIGLTKTMPNFKAEGK